MTAVSMLRCVSPPPTCIEELSTGHGPRRRFLRSAERAEIGGVRQGWLAKQPELQVSPFLGIVRLPHAGRQREPVLQRRRLVAVFWVSSQMRAGRGARPAESVFLGQRRGHSLLEK